jgi:hypothetical protein
VIVWLSTVASTGVLPITIEDGSFGDIHQIWINRSDETTLCFISGKLPISSGSDEMKIEANPTPEQIKWLILAIMIAAGLGHEQILGLLA